VKWKNIESQNAYALYRRGHSKDMNKNTSLSRRSKSRGRPISIGKFIDVCWRCGKEGITRNIIDPKLFRKGRALMILL